MTEWHQSSTNKKNKEQQPFEDGINTLTQGLPKWCSGKESACQCRRSKRRGSDPWVQSLDWEDLLGKEMEWQPTPLPGKFHGQRNLEGNLEGNPLHCLENSMDEEPGGQQSMGVSKRQTWLSNWASKTLAYTDIFECHAQHRCQRVPSSELYK